MSSIKDMQMDCDQFQIISYAKHYVPNLIESVLHVRNFKFHFDENKKGYNILCVTMKILDAKTTWYPQFSESRYDHKL
jgi:hypothetical protein